MGNEGARSVYHRLFAAAEVVAEYAGFDLRHPAVFGRVRDPKGMLDAVARASRIRSRDVLLAGEWWKRDHGPMVAFLKEGSEPVALIPAASGKYLIHRPDSGLRERVDRATAETLGGRAVVLYRPFPLRPMGAFEVFKFGMRDCHYDVITLTTMGILGGLLGLMVPIMTGWLVGTVIPSASLDQHMHIFIGLTVAAIGAAVFQIIQGLTTQRIQGKTTLALQAALWDRLISLPTAFFRGTSAGETVERGMAMENIQQMISGQILQVVMRMAFSVFNLALLFYYSSKLALWALVLVLFSAGVAVVLSFREMGIQRKTVAIRYRLAGLVLQLITGIAKLRVAGAERRAFANWAGDFSKMKKIGLEGRAIRNTLNCFMGAVPVAATIMMFFAMASPEMQENLSLGNFLAFNAALGQFIAVSVSLASVLSPLFMIIPAYEQANKILKTMPEYGPSQKEAGELSGRIDVMKVSFRYQPRGPDILSNVTFQIFPGELVAVVGPSGSGKSTLLRMLLGLDRPTSGAVLYDGQPLSALDIGSVRRQLGVVLQDGQLMQGTIFTNIIGANRCTLDEAWEAARMAGLARDIKEMPMQMHTVVPQGGGTLSGGQKQRIQIARALVNRPKILFFDEATSALDNRTQLEVQRSLNGMAATRLVIAHRLSTIRNADRIIVLKDGRIHESGTYEELIAREGLFAELARRQLA